MWSTMQDEPLSLGRLLESAAHRHGASTVSTWTGTTTRARTYAEVGERAAQVAGALTALSVGPSDRVATFM
jgi:fatty-acyl-CoA synthase